jgi:hypothetical protein
MRWDGNYSSISPISIALEVGETKPVSRQACRDYAAKRLVAMGGSFNDRSHYDNVNGRHIRVGNQGKALTSQRQAIIACSASDIRGE